MLISIHINITYTFIVSTENRACSACHRPAVLHGHDGWCPRQEKLPSWRYHADSVFVLLVVCAFDSLLPVSTRPTLPNAHVESDTVQANSSSLLEVQKPPRVVQQKNIHPVIKRSRGWILTMPQSSVGRSPGEWNWLYLGDGMLFLLSIRATLPYHSYMWVHVYGTEYLAISSECVQLHCKQEFGKIQWLTSCTSEEMCQSYTNWSLWCNKAVLAGGWGLSSDQIETKWMSKNLPMNYTKSIVLFNVLSA